MRQSGARPVRIGNGAYSHRQHDVWGTILDSFYLHTKSRDGLPDRFWPILCKQVEKAITHWREPDRGIWEIRGEEKHFTHSRAMVWAAFDRGARGVREFGLSGDAGPRCSGPATSRR